MAATEQHKTDMKKFSGGGIGVAPVTPFTADGEVNYSVFGNVIDYLQKSHTELIFVNGTLGEGMNLQVNERKLCAERWIEAAKGRIDKVIVHVGAGNLKDSQELARHAEEIGAPAIAAISPTFYKPEDEDMMVEYMSHVASAAPRTPFYYYDFDTQTGITIDVLRFIELASQKIPTFRGVKYTSVDLPNWVRATELENGSYDIFVGCIDMYLPCLSVGVRHPITLPFFGDLFHSIRTSYDAGNMEKAKAAQHFNSQGHIVSVTGLRMEEAVTPSPERKTPIDFGVRHPKNKILKLLKILSKYGKETGVFKAAFSALSGVDMGPVRLPLRNVTSQQKGGLLRDLRENGFL